jgi:hypothetical protein
MFGRITQKGPSKTMSGRTNPRSIDLAGLSWKELATLAEANLENKQCVVILTFVVPWRKG